MHSTCCLHWLPLMLISRALAAEYVVPSTWNGTNITASSEQRQLTIAAAIQEEFTNGTSPTDEDFYSILAVCDFYSNTTLYKNQVSAYFATATFQPNNNKLLCTSSSLESICLSDKTYILVFSNLGIDAVRAYRVYGDSAMLDLATQVWEFCRSYTISPGDVSAGSIATKSFNVGKTCSGGACILFLPDI
ncbi:hypothetical protein BT96DRAFT_461911 [Gymnopus androsaceus JB14]|uniref:Uncharacterized protein n=1 Tax=Gymnopus androsaceus JB14 TaxID=1447944 RepID=A0A6A4IH55_9AGAR|nr:hypothetical protein BT96DRAFT_461911 [Gymnopus androsaceus JB14]